IAAFSGLTHVFKLRGSDVYRVEEIERMPGEPLIPRASHRPLLAALRASTEDIGKARDLESLFERLLASIAEHFGIQHSMVLLLDPAGDRFFAVASRG